MFQKEPREEGLVGAFLVFIAAAAFSAKAVMIKLAYRYDVDPITLLSLRMAFSLPFFAVMAAYGEAKTESRVSRGDAAKIVFLGLAGFYLSALLDFMGLLYVSAGFERLILFLYPTIVVLISAVLFGERMTKTVMASLALSYVGVALALSNEARFYGKDTLYGAALVFGCAFTYAIYLVGADRVIARAGTLRFTGYAMTVSCLAVLVQYGATRGGGIFHLPGPVYRLGLLMALVSTVLPVLLMSEGMRRIGAGKTAIISSVGPVFTIFTAYVFLGEKISALQVAGTALIIAGVVSVKESRA